ncbi:MAG: recombinase family protein [Propionibacteriaceae bacterium]|nr:recombinase family protein [Propionibacteriaceae bacterium]
MSSSEKDMGLVRVSTSRQETARQHDVRGPICERLFEEKVSGKLAIDARLGLTAAIDYMRGGDMLTVQEVDRLGRNLLAGIASGEHTERNLILYLVLALVEDRRRDIARKTRNGLDAARKRDRTGGSAPRSQRRKAPHHHRSPP